MKRSDLLKLVQAAMDEYDIYGPVQRRTTWVFDKIDDPSRIDMDYDNTMMSLKKFFIPSKEVMMRFNLREMSVDDSLPDVKAERPRMLVGVHACDIHALLFLDRVFGGKYVDPY
jgi:sulfhydrogenase subunit beta (sulfur reductase)